MSEEKIKLSRAVVVEGKYDKIKLSSIIDAVILTTDGFGIYKDSEMVSLIRFYAKTKGLIVMTDSDAAGRQIRAYIKGILPSEQAADVVSVHIPKIQGKEKRKEHPSKEGTLGVEGIDADILRQLLSRYAQDASVVQGERITKNDMYMLGLSGRPGAAQMRSQLCDKLVLPSGLSSSSLLDLLNSLFSLDELVDIVTKFEE